MSDSPNDDNVPTFAELEADPEIAPLLEFSPAHRKVKRPDGWTPELQREFIARLAHTGTPQAACKAMGKHVDGIKKCYVLASAHEFRAAWDAAEAIGRRRNHLDCTAPLDVQAPGTTRRGGRGRAPDPHAGEILNEFGEYEDEAAYARRGEDALDSIRDKLLRCRRLFLQEISASAGKRAAFEILTELPVNWDKAAKLEPQPDEPWNRATQRQPDMILTAESGWMLGEHGYGPDKKGELQRAIDEHRAEEGLEPVDWSESAESKTNDGEADASA